MPSDLPRTGLLVSVRDADEAEIALNAGAEIIDVKEPHRGPLGRASDQVIQNIVARVARKCPVSVALGELPEHVPTPDEIAPGIEFAKLGLAGCFPLADWAERWRQAVAAFPSETAAVAVVYADWQAAAAPPPGKVIEVAMKLGCRAVLIDTFNKSGGNLLAHWPLASLADFVDRVKQDGMAVVLGGSLDESAIRQVLPLRPRFLAVRTAACAGGRTGQLAKEKIVRLAQQLAISR